MKTTFKFFPLAALALMLGFTGCSKSDGDSIPDGEKRVVVQMSFVGTQTRAEGNESAVNQSPNFSDLSLIFVGNGIVLQTESLDLTTEKGALETGKAFTVPTAVEKVYAVGNHTLLSSPSALPAVNASETTVKALALEVDKQTNFKDVNLSAGQSGTNGGSAFAGASFSDVSGTETATFDIVPAFARYEIKKVSASATASQPLKSFKLTGIFITNTYRTIGLDYETVATVPADIFNFGPTTANFATAVPAYLQDVWDGSTRTAATEFVPENPVGSGADGPFWHYMMAPPIAGKGTVLEGNGTDRESSVPVIVLRIENAIADDTQGNTATYASPSYVSVRNLKAGSDVLTFLRPGYVYQIDDIAFGGENLTKLPAEDKTKSVTVSVTFKQWQGQPVTPEL